MSRRSRFRVASLSWARAALGRERDTGALGPRSTTPLAGKGRPTLPDREEKVQPPDRLSLERPRDRFRRRGADGAQGACKVRARKLGLKSLRRHLAFLPATVERQVYSPSIFIVLVAVVRFEALSKRFLPFLPPI